MNHQDYLFTITVEGADYPCALTNGALLRFAETTGHDFGTSSASQQRDTLAIIHACAVSGAAREGREFPLTLMELADRTSPADLAAFAEALTSVVKPAAGGNEGAKKKAPTVIELQGIAIGEMRMSRADFLLLTPAEFEAALKAHAEARRASELREWHRLRTLASIVIRPHIKKGIAPSKLIPLPELDGAPARNSRTTPEAADADLHARLSAASRAFAEREQLKAD